MPRLTLVSHPLCPYVQRAAIALRERSAPYDQVTVDIADRPEWFAAISPLGKVPLLRVAGEGDDTEAVLFESAVILEYLEETLQRPLHPADPIARARHRGWIEFSSAVLNGIGRFYATPDEGALAEAATRLAGQFAWLEAELGDGPWFAGDAFRLVDAAFGPVFRYFDRFDRIAEFGILTGKPRLARWRTALAARPSVRDAVAADYPERLDAFLRGRGGALSRLMAASSIAA